VPKCILIVDDNDAIRAATRHFLEKRTESKVCVEATDGFDAIEKARHLNPDLIILDLSMPRMNGLEAARALRAMSVDVPILLFTMYCDDLPQESTVEAGISAVVSKMDFAGLQQCIEQLLVAT
jgi:CheY-like chemotaxis protein